MAASDEWTEWHLTPRGWEKGSNRVDGRGEVTKSDPEGSVLVYRYSELLSSIYSSKADISVDSVRGDRSAQVVVDLLKKFGPCPERLF